jgi:hypothetical protein
MKACEVQELTQKRWKKERKAFDQWVRDTQELIDQDRGRFTEIIEDYYKEYSEGIERSAKGGSQYFFAPSESFAKNHFHTIMGKVFAALKDRFEDDGFQVDYRSWDSWIPHAVLPKKEFVGIDFHITWRV